MNLSFLALLLPLPALLDALLCRSQGATWGEARRRLALCGCRPNDLLAALALALGALVLGALALALLPSGAAGLVRAALRAGRHMPPDPVAWLAQSGWLALAEELLLRGWLAGLLVRTLGLPRGNALQALAAALPYLALLPLGPPLWALALAQVGLAWALGRLRWRSGSLLPGWLAHSLLAALALLV